MLNPPSERDLNKFATTNLTNEHARAIASLISAVTGQVDEGGPPGGDDVIFARIVSSSQDGGNWRWTYTFEEVEQSAVGLSGVISARSGGVTGNCYNTTEYGNGSTGGLNSGTDADDLTGTGYTPKPVKNNTPVFLRQVLCADGNIAYWFTMTTGVAGGC